MDSMDVEWCEGVSRCGEDEMGRLSSLLVCVRGLSSSSVASDVCDAVVGVLDCLERCGSVVLQSVAVLAGTAGDAAGDRADVLRVLESLRGLSDARLDAVCSDEAAAYDAVVGHLSGLESCVGTEIVSSCMALFTLGCRNGGTLCGRVDVLEAAFDTLTGWLEYLSSGADACEYETGAASSALFGLCGWECGPKLPPESRRPFEQAFKVAFGQVHAASGKTLIEERVCDVFISSMKAGMLSHDDTSLACGWSSAHLNLGYMHPGALPAANESGVFSAALALYRRVEPSPLGGDWWLSTCDVVDVTSTRLFGLWALFALVKRLPSAMQSSWWSELLDHAIRMCKVNASARLSERETMCCTPFVQTLGIVEMAARDESQHEMLAASGVADALDYAILHDFTYVGISIASYAAGAAVARSVRLGDQVFDYQTRAQGPNFVVDRRTGVNLVYDPCGWDVGTQTPYLWPEGLGGYRHHPDTSHLPETGAGSSGARTTSITGTTTQVIVDSPERFSLSRELLGESTSSGEEIDDFWRHDGHSAPNQ